MTEQLDPIARELRRIVEKMSVATQSPVVEVLKRPKSRAHLFGKLRSKFPRLGEEALRQIIESARWASLSCAADHETPPVGKRRPPSRGREPLSSPKWDSRIEELLDLLDEPMTTKKLFKKARRAGLQWSGNFFTAVISAADGRENTFYGHPFWAPLPRRCWKIEGPAIYENWITKGRPYMESLPVAEGHGKSRGVMRVLGGQPLDLTPSWLDMRAVVLIVGQGFVRLRFVTGRGTCFSTRLQLEDSEQEAAGEAAAAWLRDGSLDGLPTSDHKPRSKAQRDETGVMLEASTIEELLALDGLPERFRAGVSAPPRPPTAEAPRLKAPHPSPAPVERKTGPLAEVSAEVSEEAKQALGPKLTSAEFAAAEAAHAALTACRREHEIEVKRLTEAREAALAKLFGEREKK